MNKTVIAISSLVLAANISASGLSAADSPLWLRHSSISPDGEKVAFSYQGDIFVVSAKGGRAFQLTTNPAYESDPIWTPDSKSIVFSSIREKSKDIFITDATGGEPKRITDYPGQETPLAVLPDGRVIFSANIQQDETYSGFPGSAQIYEVSPEGGRPRRVTSLPMAALTMNADGVVLYEDIKGYEDPLRKHHTSSVTRDIWMYTPGAITKKEVGNLNINGNGTFTKLTDFEGEDRNPLFAADGNTYYYISERNGSFNIYRSSISDPKTVTQVTFHKTHPVRYVSLSDDGTLAYSYDGELYTVKDGSQPQKISIEIAKDRNERALNKTSVSMGITSIDASPNGKEIAIVARGEVFVTSIDYRTTKRITDTPQQERGVSFSKDGRTLYYASERDGHWGIYATSLTEKEDKYFTYSVKMEEKMITSPDQTCFQPSVSPDGEWLAFLRDRTEIVIKNIKSGKEKSLLKDINYSYTDGDQSFEWSPDSQWILCNYQANGGWNNEDIALINIETGEITNLTESGYTDSNFRWAMKGKAMTWMSDKDGYRSHGSWGSERDVYVMFFDAKAYKEFLEDKEDAEMKTMLAPDKEEKKEDKKDEKKDSAKVEKKAQKLKLDLENRTDRTIRLTRLSGMMRDCYLTDDGSKLYYIVRLEKSFDLCVLDTKENSIKVVDKNITGYMQPSRDGKYIYMLSRAGVSRIDVKSGSKKSISFKGEYDYRPQQEREYIFNHIWKQVKEKFYDPEIHGIDWEGYRRDYSRFLPYIDNNFDFQEMLSEMLGELNGSHTGARYYPLEGVPFSTLGVIYDDEYTGDGLKIKEVLKGGVLAVADPEIQAGDVITSVNGTPVKAGESWYGLFVDKAGEKVLLTVSKKGKKPVELWVEPVRSDSYLLYKRWVKRNEETVARLSGGKVGYIHIEGMDSDSFREAYSKLLGKYRTCDAVIVDTRHNGGGWLHDDLVTLLSGKAYINFEPRGQYISTEPYSKWTKPSCVLIGEDNYSDASGFPYVYKTLGIGKLIGAPVPGTMTAVWWESQIDPTLVFGIPQVGSVGIKEGRYLENLQVEPDILVYNDPASVLNGEDKQLEAAVEEMLRETGNK